MQDVNSDTQGVLAVVIFFCYIGFLQLPNRASRGCRSSANPRLRLRRTALHRVSLCMSGQVVTAIHSEYAHTFPCQSLAHTVTCPAGHRNLNSTTFLKSYLAFEFPRASFIFRFEFESIARILWRARRSGRLPDNTFPVTPSTVRDIKFGGVLLQKADSQRNNPGWLGSCRVRERQVYTVVRYCSVHYRWLR